MPMIQLIYASRPFDFDEGTLAAILTVARGCNERDGITGALICRSDLYLQLLEDRKTGSTRRMRESRGIVGTSTSSC